MALIVCPDCQSSISDKAPACPVCGRPNDNAYVREVPPHEVRYTPMHPDDAAKNAQKQGLARWLSLSAKGDWKGGIGCFAVIALLIAFIWGAFHVDSLVRGVYSPKEADAYTVATMAIKSNLKARMIARFPTVDQIEWSKRDQNTYVFRGSFHTKDQSGQSVSKPFSAVVAYVGSGGNYQDDWSVIELKY